MKPPAERAFAGLERDLNEANFADPVRFMSSPMFGRSTSMLNLMLGTGSPGSGLAPILQTGGARSFQAALRFYF